MALMYEFSNGFEEIKRQSARKTRKCMYRTCEMPSIKSHVLQKNGILNEISFKGHVIEGVMASSYNLSEKEIAEFKRTGVNNAYCFQGFCKNHDTSIFKPIESEKRLDINSSMHQALFCYRGLCQEIRRKEIVLEWLSSKVFNSNPFTFILSESYKKGIKNLEHFKTALENSIKMNTVDQFYFETIKIPRIDLCISVSLNIEDKMNKKTKDDVIPFVTSFLNIFPKGSDSFVIVGYHKDYPCLWTDRFVKNMKTGDKLSIFKEISDLIVLRLEFWAMSISLFDSINKSDLEKSKEIMTENVTNHDAELSTNLNLFKHLI
jgi:hypothetical protein